MTVLYLCGTLWLASPAEPPRPPLMVCVAVPSRADRLLRRVETA